MHVLFCCLGSMGSCNITQTGQGYLDDIYGPTELRPISIYSHLSRKPLRCKYIFTGVKGQRILLHITMLKVGEYNEVTKKYVEHLTYSFFINAKLFDCLICNFRTNIYCVSYYPNYLQMYIMVLATKIYEAPHTITNSRHRFKGSDKPPRPK